MHTDVVVLAAGKGTRMQSNTAKVLHQLAGKSLIHHVLETARTLKPRKVAVVIGIHSKAITAMLNNNLMIYIAATNPSSPISTGTKVVKPERDGPVP